MKTTIFGHKAPGTTCQDKKCPFHGEMNVKKEFFTGKVVRKDLNRSATIQWSDPFFVPKYERYEIRRRRARVHNPACIDAQIGDEVIAARSRPLSKTKNHIIIAKVSRVSGVKAPAASKSAAEKESGKKVRKNQTVKEVTSS